MTGKVIPFLAILLASALSNPYAAHANEWVEFKESDNMYKYLRLDSQSNGISYVSTMFFFNSKKLSESDWVVNCKENVMVNNYGTEWIKISGIWRLRDNNKAGTPGLDRLYDFACLN